MNWIYWFVIGLGSWVGGAVVEVDAAPSALHKRVASDYAVSSLPGIKDEVLKNYQMYSGFLDADRKENHLFFWLVDQHSSPTSYDKLVIWLNGGPGCSSLDGMFLEIGPFKTTSSNTLTENPYSWTKESAVLFVEQPVGTGFSYSDGSFAPRNVSSTAEHFVSFLENFLAVFKQYQNAKLYIAGESFAGTYIPYIAKHIASRSKSNPDIAINLNGILLGNSWMDAKSQYSSYVDFVKFHNLVPDSVVTEMLDATKACLEFLNSKSASTKPKVCEKILHAVLQYSKQNGAQCLNMYDIRLRDSGPDDGCGLKNWPPGLKEMTYYLNLKATKAALHAEKSSFAEWTECRVNADLQNDQSAPAIGLLPSILKNLRVMLFSGDMDLICNWIGTNNSIATLEWDGHIGFTKNASRSSWRVDGVESGSLTKQGNLEFLVLYNGSHMPAVDNPKALLSMLKEFISPPSESVNKNPPPSNSAPALPKATDLRITDLPGLSSKDLESIQLHSGFLPADVPDNQLFFLLADFIDEEARLDYLVIWLNGGPGCSSLDGMFLEAGPFRFTDENSLARIPLSWVNKAAILFVEQPVGTGYSFTKDQKLSPENISQSASQLVSFLENFYKVFAPYRNCKLYIAGESFAGMYIPYIAKEILARNKLPDYHEIYLEGLLIGNGWIDPKSQYNSYLEFVKTHSLLSSKHVETVLAQATTKCMSILNGRNSIGMPSECEHIMDIILKDSQSSGDKQCVNMYDLRLRDKSKADGCGAFSWPPGVKHMAKYLSQNITKYALHAEYSTHSTWSECRSLPKLQADSSPASIALFPELLTRLKVLLFSGDMDLICNWMGTRDSIAALSWDGHRGFTRSVSSSSWMVNNKAAGVLKTEGNLYFLVIANASHMPAVDDPIKFYYMLDHFLGDFDGKLAPLPSLDVPKAANTNNESSTVAVDDDGPNLLFFILILSGLAILCYIAYHYRTKLMKKLKSAQIWIHKFFVKAKNPEWHELQEPNEEDGFDDDFYEF